MVSTHQATPPTVTDPTPGQQVPVGDQCPHCGVLKTFWLYNPFALKGRDTNGWLMWRTQHCACPDYRPAYRPRDPEIEHLDSVTNWECRRHQTFKNFSQEGWRKALPAYRFCVSYVRRLADGPKAGVCLCGPPSAPREHLLAATIAAVRASGTAGAVITYPHLLQLLDDEEREHHRAARDALRRVRHLAISGLFADPATPVELKGLHQLLDERYRTGRITHATLHRPPAFWRSEGDRPAVQAEIALLLEQIALAPVAVPG